MQSFLQEIFCVKFWLLKIAIYVCRRLYFTNPILRVNASSICHSSINVTWFILLCILKASGTNISAHLYDTFLMKRLNPRALCGSVIYIFFPTVYIISSFKPTSSLRGVFDDPGLSLMCYILQPSGSVSTPSPLQTTVYI